jgi:hypothetical protein
MIIKPRYILIILAVVLTACGNIPLATETPTKAAPITTERPTPLPTFTPPPLSIAIPASTSIPSPAPIPISTMTEIFPLDNLRMAYIVDGNLYVQNGSNLPKQLSNSGEDHSPIFSNDGEKIIFYRGKMGDNNSIFSTNPDGSHEQELITTDWLNTLGAGTKAGRLEFVPKAHKTLFNTYLCHEDDLSLGCAVGLFLADADIGKIKEIMVPALGGDLSGYGNFSISPDGKLMSVAHEGQIDILNIDGKVIYHDIIQYTRSAPIELYPRVFWLSDSSGLIVALFDEIEFRGPIYSGYPAYTFWRYSFDDNVAIQIPLDPPPTWVSMDCNDVMSVSQNGNWGVYHTNDYQVYIGNLVNGSSHLYLPYMYCLPEHWSSDNIHFINGGNPDQPLLGTIDKSPAFAPGYFLGWIDTKRFIYISYSSSPIQESVQILVGEINGDTLLTYKSNISIPDIYQYSFTFTLLDDKTK